MTDPAGTLRAAILHLRAAGVTGAATDARRLMELAAGIAPGQLSSHLPDRVDAAALERFAILIARRAARVPVSRLIGERSFFGRDFRVTAAVLDPRSETEHIVEQALADHFLSVLDLGTGTGCILLTLLAERAHVTGTGTDLSDAALRIAQANAARLNLSERVDLLRSDWFAAVAGRFDLIVSNPPYIAMDEMADLEPEVRDHDPHQALTDGADGLSAYRAIAAGAPQHLTPGGRLIVEIGWRQGAAVRGIFRLAGLTDVQCHPDLSGRDRVVTARLAQRTAD